MEPIRPESEGVQSLCTTTDWPGPESGKNGSAVDTSARLAECIGSLPKPGGKGRLRLEVELLEVISRGRPEANFI